MRAQMDSILALIGSDTQLRRVASTNGGEYAGPCPWCGGRDRFRVWPELDGGCWWCRQCGRSGDTIAYLVESGRIDKREAYTLRHGDGTGLPLAVGLTRDAPPSPPQAAEPPDGLWQQQARR